MITEQLRRNRRLAIVLIVAVLLTGAGTLFGVTRKDAEHEAISAMDDASATPKPLISQKSLAEWRHDSTNTPISSRQAIDIALNANAGATHGSVRFGHDAAGTPIFIVHLDTGAAVTVSADSGRIMR